MEQKKRNPITEDPKRLRGKTDIRTNIKTQKEKGNETTTLPFLNVDSKTKNINVTH